MAVWKAAYDCTADIYAAMKEAHIIVQNYGYVGDLSFLADVDTRRVFDRRYLNSLRRPEDSKLCYDNILYRFFLVKNEAADEYENFCPLHFVLAVRGREVLGVCRIPEERVYVYLTDEWKDKSDSYKTCVENDYRHAWLGCSWVDWNEFVGDDEKLAKFRDYKLVPRSVKGVEIFFDEEMEEFPWGERWEATAPKLSEENVELVKSYKEKFHDHALKLADDYNVKRQAFINSL